MPVLLFWLGGNLIILVLLLGHASMARLSLIMTIWNMLFFIYFHLSSKKNKE